MATPASLGWAAALASLGQAVPGIARQFNMDLATENDLKRKAGLKKWGEDVFSRMPKYGSALEELAGGMSTEQAQEVLASTPEPEKRAAAEIVSGKRGIDAMRLAIPKAIPEMPMPEGGALGALANTKNPRHIRNAFVNRFMDAVAQTESGGADIGAHPRAKNGYQAFGRFGVVPELHAQRVGLDPSNPADLARFKADPELQRAAAEHFVRELGGKFGWDPAMMRRGYYGMPSDPSAPQFLADGRRMPSGDEDTARFLQFLGDVDRPDSEASVAPTALPWENSLLADMVKERPKMKTLPRRVTYGDQERYLLSKVSNPEQYGQLKDMIGSISALAKTEREEEKERRAEFEKEQDRYGENVRKDAQLKFDTWKEQGDRAHRARTLKDQSIQALRAQRESLQKQLADIRNFQTRVAAGKESPEMLAAAYPNFFTSRTKDPGFFAQLLQGDDAAPEKETVFDSQRFGDEVSRIESKIQAVDEALSSKSGAAVSPAAAPANPLSKYLIPRSNR